MEIIDFGRLSRWPKQIPATDTIVLSMSPPCRTTSSFPRQFQGSWWLSWYKRFRSWLSHTLSNDPPRNLRPEINNHRKNGSRHPSFRLSTMWILDMRQLMSTGIGQRFDPQKPFLGHLVISSVPAWRAPAKPESSAQSSSFAKSMVCDRSLVRPVIQ